jgi:uncharacterized damage-inducible protein DinB
MIRMFPSLVILAAVSAAPLQARQHMHDLASGHEHVEGHNAAVKSVLPLYEAVKNYLTAAAHQMPEELYAYRPTDEVRTFGQIVGHVANAQYAFCNGAMGTPGQGPEDFEERTSKAGLLEALAMGFARCDEAYAMDDAKAMEEVPFFGQTGTRLWVLTFNVAHDWEHYGNLVTYMRANGLVPPSSQGGM